MACNPVDPESGIDEIGSYYEGDIRVDDKVDQVALTKSQIKAVLSSSWS